MKELLVWTGPVHSGKSTQALLRAERYLRLGNDVVCVRPGTSVRPAQGEEPGWLVTKSGHRYPSIELETPAELLEAADSADVVWIDEPMLFARGYDSSLIDAVCQIRETAIVLISGLSATSELGTFGTAMSTLLALADEVFWCKADCDLCGRMRAATRSLCVVEKEGEVLVGGEETYKAACPSCWTGGEVVTRLADVAGKT